MTQEQSEENDESEDEEVDQEQNSSQDKSEADTPSKAKAKALGRGQKALLKMYVDPKSKVRFSRVNFARKRGKTVGILPTKRQRVEQKEVSSEDINSQQKLQEVAKEEAKLTQRSESSKNESSRAELTPDEEEREGLYAVSLELTELISLGHRKLELRKRKEIEDAFIDWAEAEGIIDRRSLQFIVGNHERLKELLDEQVVAPDQLFKLFVQKGLVLRAADEDKKQRETQTQTPPKSPKTPKKKGAETEEKKKVKSSQEQPKKKKKDREEKVSKQRRRSARLAEATP